MPSILEESPVPGVRLLYRLATVLAFVSGLFCIALLAVLAINYHGILSPHRTAAHKIETVLSNEPSYRLPADDSFNRLPTDYQSFLALRQALTQNRQDENLRTQIRQLDHDLRIEYFHRRAVAERTTYFLLAASILFLVALRTISVLKRPLPDPHSKNSKTPANARHFSWGFAVVIAWFMLFGGLYLGILFAPKHDYEQIFLDRLLAEANAPVPPTTQRPAASTVIHDYPASDATPTEPVALTEELLARNWVSFRNFDGNGIGFSDNPPIHWDATTGENIVWQSAVPLPGNSSPVIWTDDDGGGKLFLTGADENHQHIFCYNIVDGSLLWDADVSRPGVEVPNVDKDTGFAAPTPVVDGRHVYAMFANGELVAVDFAGNLVWRKSFGLPDNMYGFSSSPALHFDRLIVQFDNADGSDGTSRIVALDLSDGSVIWETPREAPASWASPTIKRIGDSYQIIVCANDYAIAYDPADGSEIWRVRCLTGADVGPSAISHGNVVLITNTSPRTTAIDATGTGNVTETHVLWIGNNAPPDTVSPLASDDYYMTLDSYGFLTGYDPTVIDEARRRARFWELEVGNMSSFYSSPLRVGTLVYAFDKSRNNPRAFVLDLSKIEVGDTGMLTNASEQSVIIAVNSMLEPCVTSPAVLNDRLYIRSETMVYCIGQL
ncbi:MAG: PQQ-binding-like beta-propeller repeat protein [Planctomycetaceae bacterium]|nr:PQQ-binding-like beta-propeller repeat protein [Planctomycetaceae bacterium]